MTGSRLACASIIHDEPGDVLVRPANTVEPTPSVGPKLHFVRGAEIVVYQPDPQGQGLVDLFSILAVSVIFGAGFLLAVPHFQRILIGLKLLD
jgi:hypothetical protein